MKRFSTWQILGISITKTGGVRISLRTTLVILTLLSAIHFVLSYITLQEEKTIHNLLHQEKMLHQGANTLKLRLQARDERAGVLETRYQLIGAVDRLVGDRFDTTVRAQLVSIIYRAAQTYDISPLLITSIIEVESEFDPYARGRYRTGRYSGAYGLMQLKLPAARESLRHLGENHTSYRDLFDPEKNVMAGTTYLIKQILRFRDLRLGIAAYHQGPGAVRKDPVKRARLSREYYHSVVGLYRELSRDLTWMNSDI